MMIVNIFTTCSARQNEISMTCICECHAQKRSSAINQTTTTPLPKTTPTTNDSNQTPYLACTVSIVNQSAPPTVTFGPSHSLQPTQLQPHLTTTMDLISNQSVGGTTNVLAVGNPPTSLLPSMLLSAGSSNSLQNNFQSKVTTQKSVVDLLNSSCKSHEAKSLTVAQTVLEKETEKFKTSSAICCSEVENCPSNKPSDAVEKILVEANGACAGAFSNAQSSESHKVCESDGVAIEPNTALVKKESKTIGGGGAETEKEKEVIVLDDDFKPPKKRFRTPAASSSDGPVSSLLMILFLLYICPWERRGRRKEEGREREKEKERERERESERERVRERGRGRGKERGREIESCVYINTVNVYSITLI